jgi:hypothetical protein
MCVLKGPVRMLFACLLHNSSAAATRPLAAAARRLQEHEGTSTNVEHAHAALVVLTWRC